MRAVIYLGFVILYAALTFFGLGPVLLADGTDRERIATLAVVLLLYAALTVLLRYVRRFLRRRS
jgi:hypothetical protein